MKRRKYLLSVLLLACILFINSCSGASVANALSSKTVLVGSTPGDSLIKSLLTIGAERVDFIKWDLILNEAENGSKSFSLNLVFGEGQPNTRDFKGGGEKLSFEGVYLILKGEKSDIYELKSENSRTAILLVKLNDNLFHLLTPDKKLMVGGNGWSYTLSRKDALASSPPVLPSWTTSFSGDAAQQVTFGGRTPCLDFAKQYNLQVSNDCMRIKWKLILFRDSKTNNPTTYALQNTLNYPKITEGKWTIIKGIKTNSEAIIYRLDPDKPDESVSFLVGDENVLFFLDKENQLLTGNSDFSFTLNRIKQ